MFASNRAFARMQAFRDLEAKVPRLEEDAPARAKTFAHRETTLYLEVTNLRQIEKDIKKTL